MRLFLLIVIATIIYPPQIRCTKDQLDLARDYIAICNMTDYGLNVCFDSAIKIYCGKGNEK